MVLHKTCLEILDMLCENVSHMVKRHISMRLMSWSDSLIFSLPFLVINLFSLTPVIKATCVNSFGIYLVIKSTSRYTFRLFIMSQAHNFHTAYCWHNVTSICIYNCLFIKLRCHRYKASWIWKKDLLCSVTLTTLCWWIQAKINITRLRTQESI